MSVLKLIVSVVLLSLILACKAESLPTSGSGKTKEPPYTMPDNVPIKSSTAAKVSFASLKYKSPFSITPYKLDKNLLDDAQEYLNGSKDLATICGFAAPDPYLDSLVFVSKYDQSDSSKSTIDAKNAALAKKQSEQIREFSKKITQASDYLLKVSDSYSKQKNVSFIVRGHACLNSWLDTWADAGAMLSTSSNGGGEASRKWFLAAITTSLLKIQAISGNHDLLQPSAKAVNWLNAIADITYSYYKPRLYKTNINFNNHDYWAAWAIMSTGLLTNNKTFMSWGETVFDKAMQQAQTTKKETMAYLPIEIKRGALANNYMHYALVPLLYIGETMEINKMGESPYTRRGNMFHRLAQFSADLTLNPDKYEYLTQATQKESKPYRIVWLIPYTSRFSNTNFTSSTDQLFRKVDGRIGSYSQGGGNIQPLY